MTDYIDEVFGPSGLLSQRFSGYAPRAGQLALARAVDAAIRERGHLLAEAPTGVGKSLSYAVPAIWHVKHPQPKPWPPMPPGIEEPETDGVSADQRYEGDEAPPPRAVIVTANIALQEQLCVGLNERVLTADLRHVPAGELQPGMMLVGFDEERVGHRRRFRTAEVLSVDVIRRPSYKFTFDDGSTVVCSEDHLWLCTRSATVNWLSAKRMVARNGRKAGSHVIRLTDTWEADQSYAAGYMAAAVDGEGWLTQKQSSQIETGVTSALGFSQNRNEMLDTMRTLLSASGYKFSEKRHGRDHCKRLVLSGRQQILSFLGKYRPKRLIRRFNPDLLGTLPTGKRVEVVSKEYVGEQEVVAISTSTKTLIVNGLASHNCNKDLPLLRQVLPWPFTFALLKGMSNFLCLDRLHDANFKGCDPEDVVMDLDIREWADETETGDKSELPFEPPARLWNHFSVSSDDCMGRDCRYYKRCHPKLVRARAKKADVIVTNYAMFFLDMLVRERSKGMASIIPYYSIAILDEGHKTVDIARDFFGFKVTEGSIDWAGSMLDSNELKIELHREQSKFFAALREHKRSPQYKSRIRKPEAVASLDLEVALTRVAEAYVPELVRLEQKAQQLEEAGLKLSDEERKKYKQIARRMVRARELRQQIRAAMRLYALPKPPWTPHPDIALGDTPETRWYFADPLQGGDNSVMSEAQLRSIEDVYFIEEEGYRTVLCSMPISIADRLRDYLFRTTESISVTSATLVARNSFDFIARDLGIERNKTLIAESPFAWREQALLVLPTNVPEPNAPTFQQVAIERFVQTVEFARGRTLGLFTSYKNLNAAYECIMRAKLPYRVLKQGDMPRTRLIDEFRRDVNSVLMGVESFWAGVDVQGESLSCVFIDRLPFATPDDPLIDALSEKDKDWFKNYSLPQAIIAFKQGFGRLIRTTTDRGVVVVLDRRITTKFYGKQFIQALPPVPQSTDLEDVRRFLDGERLVGRAGTTSVGGSLFDVL